MWRIFTKATRKELSICFIIFLAAYPTPYAKSYYLTLHHILSSHTSPYAPSLSYTPPPPPTHYPPPPPPQALHRIITSPQIPPLSNYESCCTPSTHPQHTLIAHTTVHHFTKLRPRHHSPTPRQPHPSPHSNLLHNHNHYLHRHHHHQ